MLNSAGLVGFVPVSDVPRARAFYEDTLGLPLVSADDYGCMFDANGATLRLALTDDVVRPPFTVLGWTVASIADTVGWLVSAGVTLHRYDGMGQDEAGIWTAPSGDRVAWFADSEGNTLSVTEGAGPAV